MKLRMVVISKRIIALTIVFFLIAGLVKISDSYAHYRWKKEIFLPGLKGKTVIIDPGHGGADPGAVADGYHEADLNMELARALKQRLEKNGVKVKMTRDGNNGIVAEKRMSYQEQWQNLKERKNYAVEQRGHLLISIHTNSHKNSTVSGAIVFYSDDMAEDLAGELQESLNTLGLRKRHVEKRNFTVTKDNVIPSVLVETGFITNNNDREILITQKNLVAELMHSGLERYSQNLKPPR